jgi:hypothetical protein
VRRIEAALYAARIKLGRVQGARLLNVMIASRSEAE